MCDGSEENGCQDYFIIGSYWHNCQCVEGGGWACQVMVHVPNGSGTIPDAVDCKRFLCPNPCTGDWVGSPTNQAWECPCQL